MKKGIAILGLALGLFGVTAARAAVSVEIQSESITGSTNTVTNGFVDVFLHITGSGNDNLQLWQTQVFLAGSPTGMTLGTPIVTDQAPNSRTMALGTDSGFTTPNGVDTNTASQASATQSIAGSKALDGEDGFGLMRVPFSVAAGATGTFQLTLDTDVNTGTLLVDSGDNAVPYTAINGTIVVSTPEPAALSLLALTGVAALKRRRRA